MTRHIFLLLLLVSTLSLVSQTPNTNHRIVGTVVNERTQQPIPYATVIVWGTTRGAVTNDQGAFVIDNLEAGLYRVQTSYLGYDEYLSPEFRLATKSYDLPIELQESNIELQEVSVTANPFRKKVGSPLSMQLIGFQEIEKSAGSNRDISKVVASFPGVGTNTGSSYRNDLLVRGGAPAENKFYLDGIEIPTINHFSTQGASGGPAGIINADFIREVEFYSGAFPVNRGNALSSVLDFKLQDGNRDERTYKFTLGASEVAASTSGYVGDKTTYLVSVRQSYLQLLFKVLDLPLLPNYTDALFKVKTRFDRRHELTLLGIAGWDYMSLNSDVDPNDEAKQYLVNSLPVITQQSYTLGGVYKYYGDRVLHTAVLSHSYLLNQNEKSTLDYHSTEGETHLRYEASLRYRGIAFSGGANIDYARYTNETNQLLYTDSLQWSIYDTSLGVVRWGHALAATYAHPSERYSVTLGLRLDANNYNSYMKNPLHQLSPRLSASYQVVDNFYINGNAGIFYQLPAYTTLGYKDDAGVLVNQEGLRYQRSSQLGIGGEYRLGNYARATLEGFYKYYSQGALSLADSIPLACKGTDYGVVGNEAVSSTAQGRAYGVEAMVRWVGRKGLNFLASYTWFRSEVIDPRTDSWIASSWDNRHLFTLTASYKLPRNWDVAIKYSVIGGSPYTPYDEEKSALIEAWDASGTPYLDYDHYNAERLPLFTQLDVRVDRSFYFDNWMLALYLDIQNILNTSYEGQPYYISTGEIDPTSPDKYIMKYIANSSGTLLPTCGITVEF